MTEEEVILHRRLALLQTLPPRNREVVQLVATPMTKQEVAAKLFISVTTVQQHLERCYDRLDLEPSESKIKLRILTYLFAWLDGNAHPTQEFSHARRI